MATEFAAIRTNPQAAHADADVTKASCGSVKPPLSPEQRQLLLKHLPLVGLLARRIHRRIPHHVSADDLISAGTLGLMDAVMKCEPSRSVSFHQYAQFRIRGAILDSLRSLDWGPKKLRRKSREIQEVKQALAARLRRSPDETELAAGMGLSLNGYHQLLRELDGLHISSLHEAHCGSDSDEEEINFLPARADENPLFQYLRGELTDRVAKAIENLPERERTVMTLYYYEEMSMREIGLALRVSEGRVSQMHLKALDRLRCTLKEMAGVKPVQGAQSAWQSAFVTC
jgi:RNA polymerase sigma factor FliA